MANYYATCRSNYFKVKDEQAFRDEMEIYGVHILDGKDGLIGIATAMHTDQSGWPSHHPASGEEIDLLLIVGSHLADGWVAVLQEIGNEKLRYLVGISNAINSKGETVQVSISDIYEEANQLGEHCTSAEY